MPGTPSLDRRLLDLLDAIDEPISISTAIRDRLGDGYLSTWRLRAATPQPG